MDRQSQSGIFITTPNTSQQGICLTEWLIFSKTVWNISINVCSHNIISLAAQIPIHVARGNTQGLLFTKLWQVWWRGEVLNSWDWVLQLSYHSQMWKVSWQHCFWDTYHMSGQSCNFKYKSSGFQTVPDLITRCLFVYWKGSLKFFMAGMITVGNEYLTLKKSKMCSIAKEWNLFLNN